MIPVLSLEPVIFPVAEPIALLELAITPSARGVPEIILTGSNINRSSATYSDLNGLSAYAGAGGFQPRNIRNGRRVMLPSHGIEDSDTKRSD